MSIIGYADVRNVTRTGSFRRELERAFDSLEFMKYGGSERVELRYCPVCDMENDHVIIDDSGGLESAECVNCGLVHDWTI